MERTDRPVISPTLQPLLQLALPSLSLPDLHNGALALTSENPRITSPTNSTEASSKFLIRDVGVFNQAMLLDSSSSAGKPSSHQQSVVKGLETEVRSLRTYTQQRPCFTITDKAKARAILHFRLGGDTCKNKIQGPIVLDEQPSYWVVQKPTHWCFQNNTKTGESTTKTNDAGQFSSESLASFLRDRHPENNFPVLSSRQHNFGVVLEMQDSWSGLTVVAKSEAAYTNFEDLLEQQLLHCYVDCFVKGPPIHNITKLDGRTAIAKTQLSVEVLRSAVCRTAGSGSTSPGHDGQSLGCGSSNSDVVSHLTLRINFPPVFLPDILWCNGLTVAADPYSQRKLSVVGHCHGKLRCIGISFPSFGPLDIREESQPQPEGDVSRIKKPSCTKKKQNLQFSISPYTEDYSQLAAYKRLLYAGLLAASPVACYALLPKAAKWLQDKSPSLSLDSVGHTIAMLRGYISGLSILQVFRNDNAPFHFNTFTKCGQMPFAPGEVEILFGEAEGSPWLQKCN